MTMVRDAFQALEHNLRHECKRLDEVRHEMEKLASSYNRYIELRQELEGRYVRITRILGLLGPEGMEIATHNDHDETIDYAIGGQFDPKELRKNLVLWQAIEQFLYCVSKASVEDIQAFLDKVGITDVSRQAIESAVKAHSKVFRVIKKGKEKYLALRESSV